MSIEVCGPGLARRAAGTVCFRDSGYRCRLNYTEHLEHLIRSWAARYPQLSHIDMDRVVLSIAKCRSPKCRGVYANIMSLRFPGGATEVSRNGAVYRLPRIIKNGSEALYLVRFYLPRFQDLPLADKIATILHELHHIEPKFNGCFRNFGGKRWAHGASQKAFERMFESLQHDVLKHMDPMADLFLNCRFAGLLQRFGDIYGDRYASIAPYEDRLRVLT